MSSASAATTPEKAPDDSSKLKTFLSILRKYALTLPLPAVDIDMFHHSSLDRY